MYSSSNGQISWEFNFCQVASIVDTGGTVYLDTWTSKS